MNFLKKILFSKIKSEIIKRTKLSDELLNNISFYIDYIGNDLILYDIKKDKKSNVVKTILSNSKLNLFTEFSDMIISRIKSTLKYDSIDIIEVNIDFDNYSESTDIYYIQDNEKKHIQLNIF
jgi:hypothetical protein